MLTSVPEVVAVLN